MLPKSSAAPTGAVFFKGYTFYMRTIGKWAVGVALTLAPVSAFAASVQIGAMSAAYGVVSLGTPVYFSLILSGFTNPVYTLVDSFPGGVSTGNLDALGNFVWVPNSSDVGEHRMTVTVTDAASTTLTATASYTVTVVVPGLTVSAPSASFVQYGVPVSFSLASSGFLAPIYSVDDSFFNSSVAPYNLNGTNFTWTPLAKDIGVHRLEVSVRDIQGHYASTTQTITVLGLASVSAANVVPGTTVGVGQPFSFVATTTGLTAPVFTVTDLFYNGATTTLRQDGAAVSWTPVYNDLGGHTFVISATDTLGRKASTELKVSVVQYWTAYIPPAPSKSAVLPAAAVPTSTASSSVSQYVFKTYLGVGARGVAVTELQKKLAALGYFNTEASGYFGAITKKAVQDFQKAQGIEQVGYVGPATRAALNK